jgi:hypothetical protein
VGWLIPGVWEQKWGQMGALVLLVTPTSARQMLLEKAPGSGEESEWHSKTSLEWLSEAESA